MLRVLWNFWLILVLTFTFLSLFNSKAFNAVASRVVQMIRHKKVNR